jgi:O-acetyl-ADP-ribose deacetylase (regulator of RNase III)
MAMEPTIFELRDIDKNVVDAWRKHFKCVDHVRISQGEIFQRKADAIVSPANSFGYMDGGIDLVYIQRFGWELQGRLQSHLREQHDGELPVGQATIIETFDMEIPYLVSAPTMRVPMDVSSSLNAYLAFRAAIRAIRQHNSISAKPIRSVLCPGLCTAVGRMPADLAAKQMAAAYSVCVLRQMIDPASQFSLSGR